MAKGKRTMLVISLVFNFLFLALIVFSVTVNKTGSVYFERPESGEGQLMTASLVVSVPSSSGGVVFNAVEIILKRGEKAYYQLSGIIKGSQANWVMETVYNHDVINVTKASFGIIITALNPGETTVKTSTDDGLRDIALIRIIE